MYLCSALPSGRDRRDFVYDKIAHKSTDLLIMLCLIGDLPPIRDQGSIGSCVGMSLANVKEYHECIDIGIADYFSPLYIYNQRSNRPASGMCTRDGMKLLKNLGCCLEIFFPYRKKNEMPGLKAHENAQGFRIKSYARIHTIDGVREALYNDGPCTIVVPVYNYGRRMWLKRENDLFKGSHAMNIVGYDDVRREFTIRNSWGKAFGDHGYCKMSYDDFDCIIDIFTMVDLDSENVGRNLYYYKLVIKNWWSNLNNNLKKFIIFFSVFLLLSGISYLLREVLEWI